MFPSFLSFLIFILFYHFEAASFALIIIMQSVLFLWHYGNTYKDITYNDFTYDDNTCNDFTYDDNTYNT
jgi:hypothetical protein